ncbi:PIN domain-containing protein [Haliovirga abyssi]|uniref:PIN domain-containing protein n=1 Tax=Haliovirga abyssi TaxID=2996794 RepID=A0AAU9DUR6_9FUSO|nr:PIN domain-containing protein [Haliovirga abyssi]BDU50994.1 hypothetical protein HLVA_15630 [Haliovirga abyssi]
MKIVDANIILRYLLEDHEEHLREAENIIENNDILIFNEVIAEVIYVLEKLYKVNRVNIMQGLVDFFSNRSVELEKEEVVKKALKLFSEKKLDFVDCLLYAYSFEAGYEIATFDKKLLKAIANSK